MDLETYIPFSSDIQDMHATPYLAALLLDVIHDLSDDLDGCHDGFALVPVSLQCSRRPYYFMYVGSLVWVK